MMDTKQQQTLKQWQWYRDKVILALCEEVGLRPSEIARLRYCDLYCNNEPASKLLVLTWPGLVECKVVQLSEKLQRNLAKMYSEPIPLEARRFSHKPVITDRPIPTGMALTLQHISRIARQGHNDKMTQTQLGAAMEQMIEDDDPIINEALNGE